MRARSLGSTRAPGEGHGTQLQYPSLENPRDRGAWWTGESHGQRSLVGYSPRGHKESDKGYD